LAKHHREPGQSQKSTIERQQPVRSASAEPATQFELLVGQTVHRAAIAAITINQNRKYNADD
jgi:hypothetical protein